jgi:hypothetical protein
MRDLDPSSRVTNLAAHLFILLERETGVSRTATLQQLAQSYSSRAPD